MLLKCYLEMCVLSFMLQDYIKNYNIQKIHFGKYFIYIYLVQQ